jgi:hypothetical protein
MFRSRDMLTIGHLGVEVHEDVLHCARALELGERARQQAGATLMRTRPARGRAARETTAASIYCSSSGQLTGLVPPTPVCL